MNTQIRQNIAGLVLAGGRSTRMGEDKAAKRLAGKPLALMTANRLAAEVSRVFINTGNTALGGHGYDLLPDAITGHQGPLAGILAGIDHVALTQPDVTHVAVVPADAPFFS